MADRAALARFLLYVTVGAAGTALHYALLVALVSLHWLAPAPASVLGALAGATLNFVLNARFTFRRHGHDHLAWRSAVRFFATAALAALANGVLMALLLRHGAIDYRIAQVLVTALLLGLTFAVNAAWTFGPRTPS
ncbi:GtrA family protein [Massilia forsythiae]|uniref:GtrA family protein n=1 Tax=Massilia forsythiae TaxID=2728020 RepID=A0A7Z2ZT68_9BURK|nr:GtrA family protein [Massilia forsythiae]QJE01059.1 GtrA family protein [Massilia forsythiae]